jgi:hypothetical protein
MEVNDCENGAMNGFGNDGPNVVSCYGNGYGPNDCENGDDHHHHHRRCLLPPSHPPI